MEVEPHLLEEPPGVGFEAEEPSGMRFGACGGGYLMGGDRDLYGDGWVVARRDNPDLS